MDILNTKILRLVCKGEGVFVNLYQLSKKLKCHRSSAKRRVDMILKRKIINPPKCFYNGLYKNLPLFVVDFVNYPVDDRHMNRLIKDKHVVGLFKIRQGEYNLLSLSFFRDILTHKVWEDDVFYRDELVGDSEGIYIPFQFLFKHNVNDIYRRLKQKNERNYVGEPLDDLSYKILIHLLKGDFLSINSNVISKKLEVHYKTVKKRIEKLLKERIIAKPQCYFPNLFSPPGRLLVVTMIETRISPEFGKYLKRDPHVVAFAKINKDQYTHLIISSHNSIATFTEWSENARAMFKEIRAAQVTFIPAENIIKSDFDGLVKYLLNV